MSDFVHEIDDLDLAAFLPVAQRFGVERFAYVVTPNADHMLRFGDDPAFRAHYRDAGYVLMDSRFVATVLRIMGRARLRICTGSDLTAQLLARIVQAEDRVLIVGGSSEQAAQIAARYGLRDLRHLNPPMGFIRDPAAVEACLEFIEEQSPFRFCFIAVGSPQQEAIAHFLKDRGRARGLALCVGASLNFLTGVEKRAPRWMQRLALEWLFRLVRDPRRMARRYLVRGPRILIHLLHARIVLRPPATG